MKTKDEVTALLRSLFRSEEELDLWLDCPLVALNNRTPRSVMEEDGGADEVFTLVDLVFNGGGGL